jgi:hypothetical protein
MTRLLTILFLIPFSFCNGQIPRQNSLLIAEYQKNNEGLGNYTHLVSYNFTNGNLTSKDTILSAPTIKDQYQGSYVRYDIGKNLIYKNRYVISGIGNVIDIQNKSLVMEENDDLVELKGDSLIFHRNNAFTGTGYLICNLKNQTYGFVKDKNFMNVKGIHSPNHQFGLLIEKSEIPCKILLTDNKNTKTEIVNDCGGGTLLSYLASTMPNVPVYWIDDQNILYAKYSQSGFTKKNIETTAIIYKINIKTKNSEIVTKIDFIAPDTSNSKFLKDPGGEIIFYCEKGKFKIDLENKSAIQLEISSIQNEFSIDYNFNQEYGRKIYFQKKEIAQVSSKYYNTKTTKGFIGVEYNPENSIMNTSKGIKVWNNITETWINIEINWLCSIIGWIEK